MQTCVSKSSNENKKLQENLIDFIQLVYYTSYMKTKTIGSFDAKTHLSKILSNVEKGEVYVITKRGKPVAKIVPYTKSENINIEEIFHKFENIRTSINKSVNIKEYIKEGRKY